MFLYFLSPMPNTFHKNCAKCYDYRVILILSSKLLRDRNKYISVYIHVYGDSVVKYRFIFCIVMNLTTNNILVLLSIKDMLCPFDFYLLFVIEGTCKS